ncbi:MAG TPA: Xaa-Pro peptidase family protein [Candidatus Limnocylindrales bacterium]
MSGAALVDGASISRWSAADRAARPARLDRLRARMEGEGVDAYFGLRAEHARYLTGFELADGEEKVAGNSGWFLITSDEVIVLADSRYTEQAKEQCPEARIAEAYNDLPTRWPGLVAGHHRVAAEADVIPQALWSRLLAAEPTIEMIPIEGWLQADRAVKEPAELERVAAACAIADAALEALLPTIRAGQSEAELAIDLEWAMRTSGAEALAFDVACLSGPRAALPHGSPGARGIRGGEVLLFDFGARVAGYRSDMTRTLFVGQPSDRDLAIYELVARAQQAALDALTAAAADGEAPSGKAIDAIARGVIEAAGHGQHFGHGLGHGIGLATHEAPSLGKRATDDPLPTPTVFSVEPGVYLPGETGVRIEDLVVFDPAVGRCERITRFPREVTVVGA